MKKFTCLFTVLCMILMLAACGGKADSGSGSQTAPAEAEAGSEAAAGSEEEDSDDTAPSDLEKTEAGSETPAGSAETDTEKEVSADSAETDTEKKASADSAETDTEKKASADSAETDTEKKASADSAETDTEKETSADSADSASETKDSAEDQGMTDEDAAAEQESGDEDPAAQQESDAGTAETAAKGRLLYMGHSSIRITTPEEKVIYIDPYAGEGYEPAADLILVTHGHYDHYDMDKVANRNPDCRIITWQEAHTDGSYQTFDLGFASVEAVEAGNNQYHSLNECVGYIITLSDGISVYVTGDTSTTEQMASLAEKEIDYAFFCCDGIYNMDLEEAAQCAASVQAKHNIPYHMVPADSGQVFDRSRAEQFEAPNLLVIEDGQEIELE